MSDYAVVILSHFNSNPDMHLNVNQVARATGIPVPTVGKILHRLSEKGLVTAVRGRFGGYKQKRILSNVSLRELLEVFEGPLTLTDCLDQDDKLRCELVSHCALAQRWSLVSNAISDVLKEITLADLLLSKRPKKYRFLQEKNNY
tara:strand:- start:2226 stop:2660 length:435 start_codon:yes stop_codon:yes gene_type:complete